MMQTPVPQFKLTIHNVAIDRTGQPAALTVQYEGLDSSSSITRPVEGLGIPDLVKCCEIIANQIFHQEFHLNNVVEMNFSLQDERGLSLWHTKPTLYMQCPLTMSMKWSCIHLSKTYKTMTTLGLVELPPNLALDGNQIDLNRTARVIMDSVANGVEFMGNLMLMRNTIDHDAAKNGSPVLPQRATG
ncbi:hypothetical protein [Rhizobium sp. CSW-27]|uniref:hypothetical protein n=1 Tax=Rhizobium sp. CSW-27 TaxID=2839985 RepID=UPI001C031AAB|nr:hypothetical protein [Rhizobium sp. CSW-27]MBT9373250.1 hypothetical protein [Rhizobium sp. CSW-27]